MAKKAGKAASESRRVKITLVKSTIGFDKKQARVVEGMGLRRLGHTVELPDTQGPSFGDGGIGTWI